MPSGAGARSSTMPGSLPKLEPKIVMYSSSGPATGEKLKIFGVVADRITVKLTGLLFSSPLVTCTGTVVGAIKGTVAPILDSPQSKIRSALVPPKITWPSSCCSPN